MYPVSSGLEQLARSAMQRGLPLFEPSFQPARGWGTPYLHDLLLARPASKQEVARSDSCRAREFVGGSVCRANAGCVSSLKTATLRVLLQLQP